MPIQFTRIDLCTDGFTRPVDWSTEVLGAEVSQLNVEVEAFGILAETPPSVPVIVTTRPPSLELGLSSVPVPLTVDAGFWSTEASDLVPGRILFRGELPVGSLGLPGAAAGTLKVASIARPAEAGLGAPTSDGLLRVGLSSGVWTPRGRATQRPQIDLVTSSPLPGGSANDERPDALRLLKYAGLEVVEARISPLSPAGLLGAALTAKALVRSPANVLYYSGHGIYASRCLGVHQNPVPLGHTAYACWARPTDLLPTWSGTTRPETFIIAGCSVLSIALDGGPPSGPGMDWLPLLRRSGGPLITILGYGSTVQNPPHEQLVAPGDNPVGNEVAQEIGRVLAQGSNTLAEDWLHINAERRAWNAVAIDGAGLYWTVTKDLPYLTAHTIHSTQLP